MKNKIELRNVNKIYESKSTTIRAVSDVSCNIAEGSFISLMGSSGSGKSTLLNLIATIDTVNSGTIIINGTDITLMNEKERAEFRKNNLSFIFQEYNLISSLTLKENIVLPLLINKNASEKDIDKIAEQLGILELLDKYPYEVSGGQKQRCACARAIIGGGKLLLADEPTGALDSQNRKQLMILFKELNEKLGITILMVTHDILSSSYSDEVLFMRDGSIESTLKRGDKDNKGFFRELLLEVEKMEGL